MIVDELLARVGERIDSQAPHLRSLFAALAGEARFARWWLDDELKGLPAGAKILEVGGGSFLFACVLACEGFVVTTVEPTGVGFAAFEELGELVLGVAARDGARPTIVRCRAEDFTSADKFRLAFSVNVMEHVADPHLAIQRVSSVLLAGGSHRFLCPNYLFPYEPHFNLPTFGSKALTERLLRQRILGSRRVDDPEGVWKSLNWITVPQVRRIAAADATLSLDFKKGTLAAMLERAVNDDVFAQRRAPWMVATVRALRATGLLHFVELVPAICQPIMDVRLTKKLEP